MRIIAIIRKSLIMQLRDYWALLLTIISAPFFIIVYFILTGGGSTTYSVDYVFEGTGHRAEFENLFVRELNAVKYADGKTVLHVSATPDTSLSLRSIRNRKTDLLVILPAAFSDSIKNGGVPDFKVYGEASNPKYSIGIIFTLTGIESLVKTLSPNKPLYTFQEKLMGNSQAKSEFDIYVPGIFIFSIIMLILSASLSIIRDVEDRTMIRLKLTKMTVFDYLAGNTVVQWIIGVFSFELTYQVAVLLGFNSQGSAFLVLLVASLTILSIIAVCLILVAFCKNAATVMIVGNFPLFILMFFTGSMIPFPRNEIVEGFAFNDILPPTHAVNALNKIYTFGAGIKEISHEIVMLVILTIVYFSAGVYFFRRNHLITS